MHEKGVFTLGHGVRPALELTTTLREAGVQTLVDVRRYPTSRRNPQFNQGPLRESVEAAGIEYRHAVELGGRRSAEQGEDRFGCIRVAAFRSYAAHMRTSEFQEALARELARPVPCFMAEVPSPADRRDPHGTGPRRDPPARPRTPGTAPALR
jgi:uncharacterized protein (DUF488 family)